MTDVNVLVVFYSRYGETEQLALAAGLGAIQARANIRLRRVADHASQQTIEASPKWLENLVRMNRDYVIPRPADPVWADVILFATPVDTSAEIERYVRSLPKLGSMYGKIAGPVAPGNSVSSLQPVYAAAACAGLTVVPAQMQSEDPLADCRTYGRQVAEMARAIKERTST